MHYMIVAWDKEKLEWRIVHYSHSYDDMQRMIERYPESAGYVHLINLDYLRSNEFYEKFDKMRGKK